MSDYSVLDWIPISHRPLKTGVYLVGHRGLVQLYHFFSPHDTVWVPHTKMGWHDCYMGELRRPPESWNATHCALFHGVPADNPFVKLLPE